jgi:Spy/CpxP family protein refolding chaperone
MSISEQPRVAIRPSSLEERLRLHELLESFENVDEAEAREQRESFEMIRRALDEDRPSNRKLFP